MEINIFDNLNKKLSTIREMGWVKNCYNGCGAAGLTLESLLEKEIDSFSFPDYMGVEIKTVQDCSKSNYINLLCMAPDNDILESERINDSYGYLDSKFKKFKILQVSICSTSYSRAKNNYNFKIWVDRCAKKVILKVYDKNYKLLEEKCSWSFYELQTNLYRKLKYLTIVNVKTKTVANEKYFYFYQAKNYCIKTFDSFINLIEKGKIRVKINIDFYKEGERFGKFYNHGMSFEILKYNLKGLLDEVK